MSTVLWVRIIPLYCSLMLLEVTQNEMIFDLVVAMDVSSQLALPSMRSETGSKLPLEVDKAVVK
jgi:hypothetical protein